MSLVALGWGYSQETGSGPRKAVLLALCNYADENGQSWPSIRRMCRDTEFSERTVRDALRDLEEAGFVTREERRTEDGAMRSNLYTIHVPARVQQLHPRGQEPPGTLAVAQGDSRAVAGGTPGLSPPEPSFRTVNRTEEEKTLSSPKEKSRASAFPADFEPNETDLRVAAENGVTEPLKMAAVLNHFRDHHVARGNVFKDWHAALRTWLRSPLLHQRAPPSQPNGFYNRPPVDLEAEAAAAYAEIERRKLKNAQCH